MKRFLYWMKFRFLARKTKLTTDEFLAGKRALLSHVAAHPVRIQAADRQIGQRSFVPFPLFPILRLHPMPITLVIALIVSLSAGGSVVVAAERSLPGDTLYTIKINVTEPARVALAANAKARAALEAELAVRRLEEAEKITASAELKPEVRAQIETNFKSFADRTKDRIAKFEADGDTRGAADLSVNFSHALRAHDAILARLGVEATSTEKIQVKELRDTVTTTTRDMVKTQARLDAKANAEVSADVQAAAEGRRGSAENKIEEAAKFIARVQAGADVDAAVIARAETKLGEARTAFAAADAQLTAKAYAEAIAGFSRAHELAQDAKVIAQAHKELKIDISVPPVTATSSAKGLLNLKLDD